MSFHYLDFLILGIFLSINIIIPYYFSKKEKTTSSYFTSNKNLNWFFSGTAMVATTFAADTPLAVTELVAKYGISGNWLWWYGSIGSVVIVYFFSHLWRNSNVNTDLELLNIRYSGKGVKILRIFRTFYVGVILNSMILAWVNLAMIKVIEVFFPNISSSFLIIFLILFAFIYTSASGLTGITITDSFQFFFAIFGCILLSYFVIELPEIGGLSGLYSKLDSSKFHFIPDFQNPSSKEFSVESFLIFITVIWWSSWYPGAEPGGGGYVAQRMLSTKDTKNSMLSTLYFTLAHYFIRPWPWILVALSSLVLFPNLVEKDLGKGFVKVLEKDLPIGMRGFIFAVFLAAYFSTIATHLNWGTSYFINDFYKAYLKPKDEEKKYIQISYLFQLCLMILSLIMSIYFIQTISGVWSFLIESSAGVGVVLILRWFLPRINVWSELIGFISPMFFYILSKFIFQLESPYSVLFNVGLVILAIISVTIYTKETDLVILESFYKKVKPSGIFWKKWTEENKIEFIEPEISFSKSLFLTFLGILILFSGLFFIGNLFFGSLENSIICVIVFLISGILTWKYFPKL